MLKNIRLLVKNYYQDDGTFHASAVAFSAAFSLFPLLLLIAALLSRILEAPSTKAALIDYFADNAPLAVTYVKTNLDRVVVTRNSVGIIAGIFLLYAGIGVFTTIETALSHILHVPVRRHILVQKLIAIAIIITAMALAIVSVGATIGLANIGKAVLHAVPQADAADAPFVWGWLLAGYFISLMTAFLMFLLIYGLIPNKQMSISEIGPGAIVAAGLWVLSKSLAGYFVSNAVKFSLVYGSLASGFIFLTWIYISALIFVFGAEIIKLRLSKNP